MKKLTKKYSVQLAGLLLLLTLLPVSCIKDDYAAKEKATVQVTFTTRAISGSSDTDAEALEEYEHMRTLRVIVARANDILYNVKYNIDEGETRKIITFSELTVNADGEDFDFYAIANEEGTGYNDWETVSVGTLTSRNLNNIATLNNGNTFIPQTAKATITVKPQQDGSIQSATIPLQFAVAKVRLTIENTSTTEQTVSGISLSGVDMTSTPLFAGTNLSGEKNGSVSLGDMTIPIESSGTPGKSTVYAYFYENTGGVYGLNATWGASSTTFDINTLGKLSEIKRGTELDITITIKKSVTTPEDFFIQVNTWDSADMEIPSFQ